MKTFVVAKMLVFNESDEVLVLRRSQSDTRRPGQWDFPGGWVDEGEDALSAAKRETKEEANIEITSCKLVFAFSDSADKYGSGTWLAFLARIQGEYEVKISHEHDAFQWMSTERALQEFSYERQKSMLEYVRDNQILTQ